MMLQSMGNERRPVINDTTTLCGKPGQRGSLGGMGGYICTPRHWSRMVGKCVTYENQWEI